MNKEPQFFSKGLFERPFMDSRIKTAEMTMKEKLLGYLVGPFGMAALVAVINMLTELYYTEVFYIDQIFGVGTYLVMSWITRVTGIISGFVVAYIIEHSRSSQGRMRPLILIGSLLSAISGYFLFYIPQMANGLRLAWVYIFNILYNGIGVTLFNLKSSLLTLSTRNQKDRNQITLFSNISSFLLVGTAVTLVVGSIMYYTMLHGFPWQNWTLLVGLIAAASLPLSFVHYYYTKERVTMESLSSEETAEIMGELSENRLDLSSGNKRSIMKQLSGLLHSRYYLLALGISLVITIYYSISGYNLNTNFCTVILGATAENNYNLIYTIASGIPLGIGILIMYPLSKKYTIRKTSIAFSLLSILGCVMGFFAKSNFIGAVIAFFIYNVGTLPMVYIISALTNAANDEIEYKYDFRPEGTIAAAIILCVSGFLSGAFNGVYETGLSSAGYDSLLGTAQPQAVYNWLYFVRYAVPLIQHALMILLLIFMDLEKKLPDWQKEIKKRHGADDAE